MLEERLSEEAVRRLYISDEQWDRTHETWKKLKPRKNYNTFDPDDETVQQYCERVKELCSIPYKVAEQWVIPHYYNGNTVDNYGWIDFSRVIFSREVWTKKCLSQLRIIENYRLFVEEREVGFSSLDEFFCIDKDKEYWRDHGTWRVPPVVLNCETQDIIPEYSDIIGRYQLIEGHSRMGYLRAFLQMRDSEARRLADKHEVYVLHVGE